MAVPLSNRFRVCRRFPLSFDAFEQRLVTVGTDDADIQSPVLDHLVEFRCLFSHAHPHAPRFKQIRDRTRMAGVVDDDVAFGMKPFDAPVEPLWHPPS